MAWDECSLNVLLLCRQPQRMSLEKNYGAVELFRTTHLLISLIASVSFSIHAIMVVENAAMGLSMPQSYCG